MVSSRARTHTHTRPAARAAGVVDTIKRGPVSAVLSLPPPQILHSRRHCVAIGLRLIAYPVSGLIWASVRWHRAAFDMATCYLQKPDGQELELRRRHCLDATIMT